MIAFTIHAYTTDSTEGIAFTENETLTEEDVCKLWLKVHAHEYEAGEDKQIFAIKRELTKL